MPSSRGNESRNLVELEYDRGVAWVTINRPEKRNAMNPKMSVRMLEILDEVEAREDVGVMVLTGKGNAFSAGMDIKEYFRDIKDQPRITSIKTRRVNMEWQWRRLRFFEKATIAMVNGWCLGGAFLPVVCCDLAIAADEAQFGLSEINWGIIPAGNVSRAVVESMNSRNGLYYVMTGELFNGKQAAEMGLVNKSVPLAELRQKTRELCDVLLAKDPQVLKAAKDSFKRIQGLPWETSEDYLYSKQEQLLFFASHAREEGFRQFLDEKTYKPGLGVYKKTQKK